MGRLTMAAALALLGAPLFAGVEITTAEGRVDVTAAQAPISDVLDSLARKTRMKVVYEGGTPRNPVTVEMRGRTPAEAVLGVLEGLGLNYALVLDASGNEVETLMIVGGGAAGGVSVGVSAGTGTGSAGGTRTASRPGRRDAPRPPEEAMPENEEPVEYEAAPAPHDVPKVEEPVKPPVPVGPLNPVNPFGTSGPPLVPGPPPLATPSPSPASPPAH